MISKGSGSRLELMTLEMWSKMLDQMDLYLETMKNLGTNHLSGVSHTPRAQLGWWWKEFFFRERLDRDFCLHWPTFKQQSCIRESYRELVCFSMAKHGYYIIWRIYYMRSECLGSDKSACKVRDELSSSVTWLNHPPDDAQRSVMSLKTVTCDCCGSAVFGLCVRLSSLLTAVCSRPAQTSWRENNGSLSNRLLFSCSAQPQLVFPCCLHD